MTNEKKKRVISVLGINIISIISIIVGICGIIAFVLQENCAPWIFLLAFSLCCIIMSACILSVWIYLAVKYRKKISIKDCLKTTFNLNEEPNGQVSILLMVATIITLIFLILALIF